MTREEALEFIAQSVKSDVDMAKVADALKALEQEPRKGHWDKDGACPFCGYFQQWKDDAFCGHCGAQLGEVEE